MKQIALIKFDDSDNPWMIYKDVGMFLYKLAQNYNWGGVNTYILIQHILRKTGMRSFKSM